MAKKRNITPWLALAALLAGLPSLFLLAKHVKDARAKAKQVACRNELKQFPLHLSDQPQETAPFPLREDNLDN